MTTPEDEAREELERAFHEAYERDPRPTLLPEVPGPASMVQVRFGPGWDRMIRLVSDGRRLAALPKMIISTAKWHAIMARAGERDRVLLEHMGHAGQIILSDILPDPEVGYILAIPAEPAVDHLWQEYNDHGNSCQYPGCTKSEEQHPR